MFKGRYKYSIDAKGRINIPAKMRKQKDKGMVISKLKILPGADGCLSLLTLDEFKKKMESFNKNSNLDPEEELFVDREIRFMAKTVELDSQGRIRIPSFLMEEAGLNDEVLIIGLGSRIELWNADKYEQYRKKKKEKFNHLVSSFYSAAEGDNQKQESKYEK